MQPGGVLMQPPGPRFFHQPRFQGIPHHQPRGPHVFKFRPRMGPGGMQDDVQGTTYDGKRIRKAIYRKTIDYNTAAANYVQNRIWQRSQHDHRSVATDPLYAPLAMPPQSLPATPMNCVTTKFIRTSTNKIKCPIFCVCWTPEGRRLVTGASSGEFTLWNGLTFNFETILQAHDSSVRAMVWSHNDHWMLTADHGGFVKYWQSNMNNVKMYQAHKDPIRGLSFCPSDGKYASCSDDGTVRVWDFLRCHEERICRGHGADVKCVDWHPQKSLIASGSKDTQQPVKLWDPRTASSLATLHAHKHTVMEVKWNMNGNWLLTASRDHLVKLFDIRNMKEEMQTFKGHKKEATTVAWHPIHESMFASGGSDGGIMFWLVGNDKELGSIDEAHEMMVWSLAWHPMGHILCSGSNDHTTKFWSRNRPGDKMRDRYNLNTMPVGTSEDMLEYDNDLTPNASVIPGMGLEYGLPEHMLKPEAKSDPLGLGGSIPGLDDDDSKSMMGDMLKKKVPYAKPVPKMFEAAWESGVQPDSKPPMGQPRPPPPGGMPPPRNQGPGPQMSGPRPTGNMGPRPPHQGGHQGPGVGRGGPRGPGPIRAGGPPSGPPGQMGPPPGQNPPRYPFQPPRGPPGPRPPYQGGPNQQQSQYNQQNWNNQYQGNNDHKRNDSHGSNQSNWQGGSNQGYDQDRNGRYGNQHHGKPGGNGYDDQFDRGYNDYNNRDQGNWNGQNFGNDDRGRKRSMTDSSGGWPDSQGGPPKMRRPNDDGGMRGRGAPRGGPGMRGGRGGSPGGRGRGRGRGGGMGRGR